MSNDFLDKPRGRWRLVLAGAVAAAVLIGLGAVMYRVIDNDDPGTLTVDPTPSASSSEVLGVNPDDLGALTVVPGSTTVEGISVGYPQTIPGAVSAAAEYWAQAASTLDPARSRVIAEIVSDPSLGYTPEDFAKGALSLRKQLGLAETGPVPAGASVTMAPVAYQLREATEERIMVLLLGYVTTQTPQAGTKTQIGVYPALMTWFENDWKVTRAPQGTNFSDLAATPGTPEAAAAGWKGLTR